MKDFTIYYKIGNEVKHTADSNGDIEVFVKSGQRSVVKIQPKKDICLLNFRQSIPYQADKRGLYFLNGYQSWTDTKEFNLYDKQRNVKKLPKFLLNAYAFDRYGDALFYDYKRNILHGYDLFYGKGEKEKFILNLNYKISYLLIELAKNGLTLSYDYNGYKVNGGREFTVADYYISDSVQEGLNFFNQTFPLKNTPKIFGYTSWYNYYQNINHKIILDDLSALDERFNLFQIDDGYEEKVGDWLNVDKEKFPYGLKPIVEKIHEKGLKAGIWLAPFVAEENSLLFKTQKHLFKRDGNGEYVKCGSNRGGFYALDLENDKARDYIKTCLSHYADMGFDFFKLDFLYAANIYAEEGTARSMTAEKAYLFLRECLKGKTILGCGAAAFNCIDKFEYLRIGPDVSLVFDDIWYMRFMHRERISTKVTLQNTVYRSLFNDRLFGNDPDVFLLRDNNIKLSLSQRKALITLNALFGNVLMTSDNVGKYDQEKQNLIASALDLFHNAKVTGYEKHGKIIKITYFKGQTFTINYDTEKGVLL